MPKHARTATLALVVAAALGFGACGSDDAPAPATTSSGTGQASAPPVSGGEPTVAGTFGEKPTITLPSPTPTGFKVTVVSEGTGPVVEAGDELTVHYLGETWRGAKVFDESYGRGAPVTFPIGVGQLIPGWDEGLVGKKVGSRVLLVLPPDKGYGAGGNPQAGIEGTDTLVFVVDIVSAAAA